MKKVWATVLTAAVLFGVCATGAWAAGRHGGGWNTAADRVCSWNDGVCDSHTCRNDADGDGVCDLCGSTVTCWGDTDGDGVCDVRGTACGTGAFRHHGRGAGYGHCSQ